jgi:hypothetical protein
MPRRGGRRWTPDWAQPSLSNEAKRMHPVFRDGAKYVNGVRYHITGTRQCWSSNGTTIYTSLMWSDGKSSCNCPGWATSKTQDKFGNPKDKTCTHSRDVREGDNVVVGQAISSAQKKYDDDMDHRFGRVEAVPKKRKIIL